MPTTSEIELFRRALLGPRGGSSTSVSAGHLPPALVEAAAEEALLPREEVAVAEHLERCAECARRVAARRAILAPPVVALVRRAGPPRLLAAAAALALLAVASHLALRFLTPAGDAEAREVLARLDAAAPSAARAALDEHAARFPDHELARYARGAQAPRLLRAPEEPGRAGALGFRAPRFVVRGDAPLRFAWQDPGAREKSGSYRLQVVPRDEPGPALLDLTVERAAGPLQEARPRARDWRAIPAEGEWYLWSVVHLEDGRRGEAPFRLMTAREREATATELRALDRLARGNAGAGRMLRALWLADQALRNAVLYEEALAEWERLSSLHPEDQLARETVHALRRALGLAGEGR